MSDIGKTECLAALLSIVIKINALASIGSFAIDFFSCYLKGKNEDPITANGFFGVQLV